MVRTLPWVVEEGATKRRKLDSEPMLCGECGTLDLETSLQQAFGYYQSARAGTINRRAGLAGDCDGVRYYEDAFLVHRFHGRLSQVSQCPMCRFFWGLRVKAGAHESYKLLAFCSSENALFCLSRLKLEELWETMDHTVFLAVVPDTAPIPLDGHEEHWLVRDVPHVGSVHLVDKAPKPSGILQAREIGERLDFSVPREWYSYCQEHHNACRDRIGANGAIERGFRVIDCAESPPVVKSQPWGVKFAALSYVWGDGVVDDWPRTVLDAVAATREMGLQYLWVDRLCIDQSNPAEKHYLIQRMAAIYEGAELTIIGAAGSAAHGLPGVGSTPRKPQPTYQLATGSKLVSTLQDPRIEIVESEWASRGWTYQEGALSNRRLVFTGHQVYWECLSMATYESIVLPLDQVHLNYGVKNVYKDARMGHFMLSGIFQAGLERRESINGNDALYMDKWGAALVYGWWNPVNATLKDHLRELDEHIRAFTARTLRYDEDSLNAFLGIAMQRLQPELVVFLGLPVWVGRAGRRRAQVTFAVSVCSWSHKSRPGSGHFVSEDCRRRNHLPSWTWAGWKGTVTWRAPPTDMHYWLLDDLINASDLGLCYVPDMYLQDVQCSISIRLSTVDSASDLENQTLRVVRIKDPIMLRRFYPRPIEKEWEWRVKPGPAHSDSPGYGRRSDFDEQWYRLDRRLVSITTSTPMTMAEWSDRHSVGELVSVLMYAGRVPDTHVRARFLTLQRAPASPQSAPRWERVGSLQLTMHKGEFAVYTSLTDFLARLPVQAYQGDILIE